MEITNTFHYFLHIFCYAIRLFGAYFWSHTLLTYMAFSGFGTPLIIQSQPSWQFAAGLSCVLLLGSLGCINLSVCQKGEISVIQANLPQFAQICSLLQAGHEFHETCHSVTFYFMKKDSKRYCDTTMPKSIHNKDESKLGTAFAFIFGVNWLWRCGATASFWCLFSWNKL